MQITKILIVLFILKSCAYATICSLNTNTIDLDQTNTVILQITNPSNQPIAYEVEIKSRKSNNKGHAELSDLKNQEDFIIIPSQMLIMPKSTEKSTITYLKKNIENSKAFRILVKQVNLNLNENNEELINRSKQSAFINLKILNNFQKNLHIFNYSQKEEIKVNYIKINNDRISYEIENIGSKYVQFSGDGPTLKFLLKTSDNDIVKIESGIGLLLSKSKIKKDIKLDSELQFIKDQVINWEISR
eukprot:COSAG01_NODE_3_length_63519_cov_1591.007663_36_plen_245_part_00